MRFVLLGEGVRNQSSYAKKKEKKIGKPSSAKSSILHLLCTFFSFSGYRFSAYPAETCSLAVGHRVRPSRSSAAYQPFADDDESSAVSVARLVVSCAGLAPPCPSSFVSFAAPSSCLKRGARKFDHSCSHCVGGHI